MSKQEITAVDYDKLLKIFCSDDDFRPEMKQPNTVGDKTYATDGHAFIVIPNSLLRNEYVAHPKTPNFTPIIKAVKECRPLTFKDTDLFKALQVHPKEYDTSPCIDCDGDGQCSHCGADCDKCDGYGWREDKSLPMVYAENGTIQIDDQYFFAFQLGRLEKVIVEMMVEEFTIIGRSSMVAQFKVGPVEIIICRMELYGNKELPNSILKPVPNEQ